MTDGTDMTVVNRDALSELQTRWDSVPELVDRVMQGTPMARAVVDLQHELIEVVEETARRLRSAAITTPNDLLAVPLASATALLDAARELGDLGPPEPPATGPTRRGN